MARFFKATSRFVDNGTGMMVVDDSNSVVKIFANSMHCTGADCPSSATTPTRRQTKTPPVTLSFCGPISSTR